MEEAKGNRKKEQGGGSEDDVTVKRTDDRPVAVMPGLAMSTRQRRASQEKKGSPVRSKRVRRTKLWKTEGNHRLGRSLQGKGGRKLWVHERHGAAQYGPINAGGRGQHAFKY